MRHHSLLERIRNTPDLERIVPRLAPSVLRRVIDHCGLEDCADLVALATPEQLAGVLDLDLWRANEPGLDERFDAERFGAWIQTLLQAGAEVAAEKLAALDADVVIAGLAQHARVFDPGAVPSRERQSSAVGGYLLVARRHDAWEAILEVLAALAAGYPDRFHRLMRGCRRLSDSRPEADGFHALAGVREQALFDLAFHREQRREAQGFVTPAQARAFLQAARQPRPAHDAEAAAAAVARAYFRAMDPDAAAQAAGGEDAADVVAPVTNLLIDEGVVAPPPRALLEAPEGAEGAQRLTPIRDYLRFALARDPAAYAKRTEDLAFLANVLLAGCAVDDRALTVTEASEGAVAACNLGLEHWPAGWPSPDDGDLIAVFQVGWAALHERVCLRAARRLLEVLASLPGADRETDIALRALRRELARHTDTGEPWRAAHALEAIAILDGLACAGLRGIIAECPVLPAAIPALSDRRARSVSATDFAFIAGDTQIAVVDRFLDALPDVLRR